VKGAECVVSWCPEREIVASVGAAQQLAEADPAGAALGAACLARRLGGQSCTVCPLPPGSLARGRWAAI
jgi:hypothetical protein